VRLRRVNPSEVSGKRLRIAATMQRKNREWRASNNPPSVIAGDDGAGKGRLTIPATTKIHPPVSKAVLCIAGQS
jgi:hypothetical protein